MPLKYYRPEQQFSYCMSLKKSNIYVYTLDQSTSPVRFTKTKDP